MVKHSSRRTVIVHYHLFKNAGTSIEKLLKTSFGKAWASWDKPEPGAKISAADMQAWIEAHPRIRAVSSHQLVPPLPTGAFDVIPVIFIREPLSRVRSAWLFEWQKQPGLDAPKGSLVKYIEEKFKQKNTSVIANFQVSRLSNLSYTETRQSLHRYNHELLPAAMQLLDQLPFVGMVDRFAESLELLKLVTSKRFPDLVVTEYKENVLQTTGGSVEQRIESLRKEIGNELFDELCVRNRLDLQLYSYAAGRFQRHIEVIAQQPGPISHRPLSRIAV